MQNPVSQTHIYTRLGNEKSSVKTWIRIWWAHRERWNASACSVPAQCKQPAHVCACLPPLKLLSISPWCPFLLIQTFVPPATTDATPPQDFIHKHSVRLQPAPLRVQLSSPACCKDSRGFRWLSLSLSLSLSLYLSLSLSHTHTHTPAFISKDSLYIWLKKKRLIKFSE